MLERVRQCLQARLDLPVKVCMASQSDTQIWQIGATPYLLATPSVIGFVPPHPAEVDYPLLLVYEYVPRALGAQLRAQGAYYADAVGNSWLQHQEVVTNVSLQPIGLMVPSPAWHVHFLRLLFQLVLKPALAAYYIPKLAAHTQLPIAVVRQVLRTLAAQGFWNYEAPLGFSPLLLPTPAKYWLAHYATTLRRRLNGQRYRPRCPMLLADWVHRGIPFECSWSGEAAALLLLDDATPPTSLTLYSHLPRPQLVKILDLVPSINGTIEIVNAFAPATCFAPTDPRCVPPLLVYADLLASQDPSHEVLATKLAARYLENLLF